jgi:eukaryotic-like serine/threonine-protein kinase
MSLSAGSRLGPYEILSAIGAGGMGQVYKARDTRLDRTVAIKILPETLAADPQFRERFDREARAISQLTHPHICTLYDVGEQQGTAFLVMEYLEGETLEHRLKKGALPLHEALRIAIQTADALSAAHRAGIVHRDLKPGNVMLTKGGAKLLDFGLAKLKHMPPGIGGFSIAATITKPMTAQGTIVGTLQYMAPEQIEGKEADARSDLFSFGALAYEMVTGKRAFEGSSPASVIAAIVEREPLPMSALQPLTPRALDHIVQACLVKSPEERWSSAADLMMQLKWLAEAGSIAGNQKASTIARVRNSAPLAWASTAIALLLAAVLGWTGYARRPSATEPSARFAVALPAYTRVSSGIAVSPDGREIVYAAATLSGESRLYRRRIDQFDSQPIAGTDGGEAPFFSPDGRWIGFFTRAAIKKVLLPGGAPIEICRAITKPLEAPARSASWGAACFAFARPAGRQRS